MSAIDGLTMMRPAAKERPRLVKIPSGKGEGWFCGAHDGHHIFRTVRGKTPQEAYDNFQAKLLELRRAGLLWEVFP